MLSRRLAAGVDQSPGRSKRLVDYGLGPLHHAPWRRYPDHPLNQEETFGPFAVVQHAENLGHAIALANGVRFGLVTSVHGRDLDHILSAIGGLDTGLIKVNAATTGVDFYAPFGGEKLSSYGPREQGMAALAFYGTTRTITVVPHRP